MGYIIFVWIWRTTQSFHKCKMFLSKLQSTPRFYCLNGLKLHLVSRSFPISLYGWTCLEMGIVMRMRFLSTKQHCESLHTLVNNIIEYFQGCVCWEDLSCLCGYLSFGSSSSLSRRRGDKRGGGPRGQRVTPRKGE